MKDDQKYTLRLHLFTVADTHKHKRTGTDTPVLSKQTHMLTEALSHGDFALTYATPCIFYNIQ